MSVSIRNMKVKERTTMLLNDSLQYYQSYWNTAISENKALTHRDYIVRAVCPQLHGLYYVKLCLLLTLIGGTRSSTHHPPSKVNTQQHDKANSEQQDNNVTNPSHSDVGFGFHRRSQGHLLIVGDPGTGKVCTSSVIILTISLFYILCYISESTIEICMLYST